MPHGLVLGSYVCSYFFPFKTLCVCFAGSICTAEAKQPDLLNTPGILSALKAERRKLHKEHTPSETGGRGTGTLLQGLQQEAEL